MSHEPTTESSAEHRASLPAETDDAALVRQARSGDTDAFGRLVARHEMRVYALIARVLGANGTAEDVDDTAQDVFVQAWRALPRFREEARFSTWLYRIATNMAIKQWHRVKRRAGTVGTEDLPNTVRAALAVDGPGPEEVATQKARDRDLRDAIEKLPEKQRTVILLHYFEDYACEEIAALLGCSVGTVWSRLHYGCRKLRDTAGWLAGE